MMYADILKVVCSGETLLDVVQYNITLVISDYYGPSDIIIATPKKL